MAWFAPELNIQEHACLQLIDFPFASGACSPLDEA